jgi:non-specific serine/threonine protein kinase
LADRLRKVGHLPALPGLAPRVVHLVRMEVQPLAELVEVILDDPALSLELLRQVNAAVYGPRDEGPVTTVRRAIQLVGLNGVRRAAASLRAWPGPLKPAHALALEDGLQRARVAGYLAQILAPGGLDLEGVRLIAQLQHLGRLLALYHFPDEAAQIAGLMQPISPRRSGERATPGLSQDAAAMAVLGVGLQSLAQAVIRQWGMGARLEELMTPLGSDQVVRLPEDADGWMRLVASCANESLWAAGLHGRSADRAYAAISARYGGSLDASALDLQNALERAKLRSQRQEFAQNTAPQAARPARE